MDRAYPVTPQGHVLYGTLAGTRYSYSYSYSYILEDSIPPTTTTFSDGRFASSSTSAVTRFRLHSPLVGRSTLTPPRWPRSLWSDGESRCDGLHLARVRVPRNKGEAGGLSAQRAYRVSCGSVSRGTTVPVCFSIKFVRSRVRRSPVVYRLSLRLRTSAASAMRRLAIRISTTRAYRLNRVE